MEAAGTLPTVTTRSNELHVGLVLVDGSAATGAVGLLGREDVVLIEMVHVSLPGVLCDGESER